MWTNNKNVIELILFDIYTRIGIDTPSNHNDILQYCYEDVCECADPKDWHSGDVAIAFRRWIERDVIS